MPLPQKFKGMVFRQCAHVDMGTCASCQNPMRYFGRMRTPLIENMSKPIKYSPMSVGATEVGKRFIHNNLSKE